MEKRINIVLKILIIMLLVILIISNIALAAYDTSSYNPYNSSYSMPGGVETLLKQALGVVQVVAGFVGVISLMWLGVSLMKDSPQGKAESKKKIYTILIGALLAFAASSIVQWVVDLVPA